MNKRPRHVRGFFVPLCERAPRPVPPLHHERCPTTPSSLLATPGLGCAGTACGCFGWMAWQALGLQFNYDFEQFFPADHPETTFYREFRETFGGDNDFLIVGFEGEPEFRIPGRDRCPN